MGKVLWHFTMSVDGFVTGPDHDMTWMEHLSPRPGFIQQYTETTGAVLGGRRGWDAFPDPDGVYGDDWSGPVFVLTHHPEDVGEVDGVTFLDCDVTEALRLTRAAAGEKNVEILSADIGRQLLDLGLIDEIHLHVAPVLLGEGTRLYDHPGGVPIRLFNRSGDPNAETDLYFSTAKAD